MTDDELVFKLQRGEEKAISFWYRTYFPRVLRRVLQSVSLKKDAEEISQDVFISCLETISLFRGDASLWTWMNKVMFHEVADFYRKKYAKRVIKTVPLLEQMVGDSPVLDMHETSELVKNSLQKLSESDKKILQMKYEEKLSVQQIAERFKVSFKSAESLLFRARKRFRVVYAELEQKG